MEGYSSFNPFGCRDFTRTDRKVKLSVTGIQGGIRREIPTSAAVKMVVPVPRPLAKGHQGDNEEHPHRPGKPPSA